MRQKVLIVGGSSDLGRSLSKKIKNTHEITNFDIRDRNVHAHQFISGSLTKIEDLNFLDNNHYDQIIHISGIHPILGKTDLELMYKVNVEGLFNVLSKVKNFKSPTNFIYISSSSAKNINSEYGKTKFLGEQLVESFTKTYNNIITTSFALRTRGFTPFYSAAYKGDLIPYLNWVCTGAVHIDDVIECVYLAQKSTLKGYHQFLVDGKNDIDPNQKMDWGKELLLKKYPNRSDIINKLTLENSFPHYTEEKNVLNYRPQKGLDYTFKIEIDLFESEHSLKSYIKRSDDIQKQYSSLKTTEYSQMLKELSHDFLNDFYNFDLTYECASILARAVIFYDKETQLTLVKYVFDKTIESPDLKIQAAFGGILDVVTNGLPPDEVKKILNFSKDNYSGRSFAMNLVNVIRRYSK